MINNRQELLKILIEKLIHTIHDMNMGQSFPLGDCLLNKQQIMIIFFVYKNKSEISVKEIAEFLHVTSGAVTQLVDYLVENKIVKREENYLDRRSVNIKLTAGTEKKFNNFKKKYLKSVSESFSFLNDKELTQFIKLVEKIETPKYLKNFK